MVTFISESDYQTAEANGIDRMLVYKRVNECNWKLERAITEPVNDKHRATGAWKRWEHIAVVTYQNFRTRLSRGMSEETAALTPPRSACAARWRLPCAAVPSTWPLRTITRVATRYPARRILLPPAV